VIVTDIAIVLLLGYSGYIGVRRGFVLVGLELAGFLLAGALALLAYRPLGSWLVGWAGITAALANLTAFMLVWIIVEIGCALLVRLLVLPRLTHSLQFSRANQIGGAIGSVLRSLVIIALALIIYAGLPLSAGAKQPVTGSFFGRTILGATTGLQGLIAHGLGHDLNSSLTIFTTPADPESTERIRLGFTTINVADDAAAEQTDLALVNHERTSRGLRALTINTDAQAVARAYGRRMFADGIFSHIDNDGHNPFDRMRAGGVSFHAAGENLALAPTLQLAHQGLMNSPGHKANILNPAYHTVGIGVIDGGGYGLMVVQDFTD
jgi:uncharacterized protein YkwD/uncharacterized membrane protein required for colicin V production